MKTIFEFNGTTYYIQKGNYFMKDSTGISEISNDDYEIAWNSYNISLGSFETVAQLVSDNTDNKADILTLQTNGVIGATQYAGTISENLNTINKAGFYTCYETATGVPSASYSWFVLHQNSNAGVANAYQRAIAYDTTLIVYERTKVASVWGSWVNTTTTEYIVNDYIQSGVTSALGSMSLTGNRFSICGSVTLTSALGSQTSKLILTLPEECRPKTAIYSPATIFSDSSCQPAFININTDGEVTIYNRTTDATCVEVTLHENYVIGG